MKTLIFFTLFILPFVVRSQNMDTIIHRSGDRIPCTIDEIKDNFIEYTREVGKNYIIESINLYDVKKYILGPKSSIVPGLVYNEDIEESTEQSNDLIFDGIINIDSIRKSSELFDIAKKWFSYPTPEVTKTIGFEDIESGQVNGKISIKYRSKSITPYSLKCIGTINFDVTISVKDGKYRYVFENFNHKGNDSAPGGPISFGKITNDQECPYKIKNNDIDWYNARWEEMKDLIDVKSKILIQDLKNLMNISKINNDW